MYWSVTHFSACAGIEITASHNPIDYNGMKIVKSKSRPLSDKEFKEIQYLSESEQFVKPKSLGVTIGKQARVLI